MVVVRGKKFGGNRGSRCDNPDNFSIDQAFCFGRIFGLLANSDLVSSSGQTIEVALVGSIGDTAHWNCPFLLLVPRSQRNLENGRSLHCIISKHFVEVSHAEEEDLVRMLPLGIMELAHHRGFTGRLGHRQMRLGSGVQERPKD